jgi:hypothetical protein
MNKVMDVWPFPYTYTDHFQNFMILTLYISLSIQNTSKYALFNTECKTFFTSYIAILDQEKLALEHFRTKTYYAIFSSESLSHALKN